jgi:hypothetical protein
MAAPLPPPPAGSGSIAAGPPPRADSCLPARQSVAGSLEKGPSDSSVRPVRRCQDCTGGCQDCTAFFTATVATATRASWVRPDHQENPVQFRPY